MIHLTNKANLCETCDLKKYIFVNKSLFYFILINLNLSTILYNIAFYKHCSILWTGSRCHYHRMFCVFVVSLRFFLLDDDDVVPSSVGCTVHLGLGSRLDIYMLLTQTHTSTVPQIQLYRKPVILLEPNRRINSCFSGSVWMGV